MLFLWSVAVRVLLMATAHVLIVSHVGIEENDTHCPSQNFGSRRFLLRSLIGAP